MARSPRGKICGSGCVSAGERREALGVAPFLAREWIARLAGFEVADSYRV